jgi:hypothetical protein
MQTIWGIVRDGRVEPLEPTPLPEGSQVLVTLIGEDDTAFWQHAADASLQAVWGNNEDDCYAALLKG